LEMYFGLMLQRADAEAEALPDGDGRGAATFFMKRRVLKRRAKRVWPQFARSVSAHPSQTQNLRQRGETKTGLAASAGDRLLGRQRSKSGRLVGDMHVGKS
jgi:hypothetical protein